MRELPPGTLVAQLLPPIGVKEIGPLLNALAAIYGGNLELRKEGDHLTVRTRVGSRKTDDD